LIKHVQINGANMLGVTHDKAVSLLRAQSSAVSIVVQRDFPSLSSSPDRSSFSGSSPRQVTAEKPTSPSRSGANATVTCNQRLLIRSVA